MDPRPLCGSNFFQFHAFCGENGRKKLIGQPLLGLVAPSGKPESATNMCQLNIYFYFTSKIHIFLVLPLRSQQANVEDLYISSTRATDLSL